MTTSAALIYQLPETFTEASAKTVVDRLIYSTEAIEAVRLELDDLALHVTLTDERARAVVSRLIDELAAEVTGARLTAQRVIRRPAADRPTAVTGAAEPPGPPLAVPDRAAARTVLRRAYDLLFLDLGRAAGAVERSYPPMIRREEMDRCEYVETFPQNAYLVAELPHDRPRLEAVRSGAALVDNSRLSEYMLNPAQCFHTYAELARTRLTECRLLTMAGDCFRHEVPWRVGGHRLPAFSMREIVFLGTPDQVEKARDTLMDQVWQLFLELGFEGRLETATDPFYFSEDAAMRQFQLLAEVKYELVVEVSGGQSYAIGSFNNIRDSLCRKFGIVQPNGNPAHSGCTALGLDRWVEATLARYGENPERWPRQLLPFCR
ncbi:class-II aminoacyl-tRNA synthetase family protein [Streptomyces swartbergensis]|uniref:hypothetical protein n=1 Tax=Streptomyces swartbergensis TaxID=487165 RepID=UPI0038149B03